MKRAARLVLVAAALGGPAAAADYDYRLHPQPVADGVYVFEGRTEHFSRANGGNIVNTGFIVTDAGAVVIDTGPSRRYGEQQRAAIRAATDGGGIAQVLLTHAHPDHFLGDQAYADVDSAALPATRARIAAIGDDLAANLYRLVGGWMEGTESRPPRRELSAGPLRIGGRPLRLIALAGHSDGDLAVYDETSRTLFAGDLVFHQRTATTPDADLGRWLEALAQLEALDFAVLVPGHGPVLRDRSAIAQTRDYLRWLRQTLREAAARGLDMAEVMRLEPPPRFAGLAVFREEFQRSVVHLYPAAEAPTLRRAAP